MIYLSCFIPGDLGESLLGCMFSSFSYGAWIVFVVAAAPYCRLWAKEASFLFLTLFAVVGLVAILGIGLHNCKTP